MSKSMSWPPSHGNAADQVRPLLPQELRRHRSQRRGFWADVPRPALWESLGLGYIYVTPLEFSVCASQIVYVLFAFFAVEKSAFCPFV
jgi:hypothetical protein